jgi:ferrous iron transport protein A
MPFKVLIPINKMRIGQSGNVVQIMGGPGLVRRLEALGIMPGRKVTKISSMFFRGPVTVKIGHTQIALGFGMSRRIMVEVDLKE